MPLNCCKNLFLPLQHLCLVILPKAVQAAEATLSFLPAANASALWYKFGAVWAYVPGPQFEEIFLFRPAHLWDSRCCRAPVISMYTRPAEALACRPSECQCVDSVVENPEQVTEINVATVDGSVNATLRCITPSINRRFPQSVENAARNLECLFSIE